MKIIGKGPRVYIGGGGGSCRQAPSLVCSRVGHQLLTSFLTVRDKQNI